MRIARNLLILKVSHSLSAWGTFAALVCFYADTMLIFTMYGGGFATIPAYLADIFGTMHVGAIHGRLLVIKSLKSPIHTMNGQFESVLNVWAMPW